MSSSNPTAPPIPRYSGVKTFFRRPHIPYTSELFLNPTKPIDAAIVGVPFDIGVSFRTGQREGPAAVRNISHLCQVNHIDNLLCCQKYLKTINCKNYFFHTMYSYFES